MAANFIRDTVYCEAASNTTVDSIWQLAGSGDFNGDGQPDILWRDGTTGDCASGR